MFRRFTGELGKLLSPSWLEKEDYERSKGPERLLILKKKRLAGLVVMNGDSSELTQRDLMDFMHIALVHSNSDRRGWPSTGEPHPDLKG